MGKALSGKLSCPCDRSCCENGTVWFYNSIMHPKDADGMINSAEPNQAAPIGALE